MNKIKYRGQALIIVNERFKRDGIENMSWRRAGAIYDLKNMTALFEALDFKVSPYKDLTGKEMKELIRFACDEGRNMMSQCFVLVISSHGEELHEKGRGHEYSEYSKDSMVWKQYVLGSDCELVKVDDIVHIFGRENNLKNKPKLFFIQACRTRGPMYAEKKVDAGSEIDVAISGGIQQSDAQEKVDVTLIEAVRQLRRHSDDINKDWHDVMLTDHLWKPEGDAGQERTWDVEPMDTLSPGDSCQTTCGGNTGAVMEVEGTTGGQPSNAQGEQVFEPFQLTEGKRKEFSDKLPVLEHAKDFVKRNMPHEKLEETEAKRLRQEAHDHHQRMFEEMYGKVEKCTHDAVEALQQLQQIANEEQKKQPPEQAYKRQPQTGREFDITGVTDLPDDVLIVYPSPGGGASFHNPSTGSRLLDSMYNMENVKLLLNGENILRYLTAVAKELASLNIRYEHSIYKPNIEIQHRLTTKVCFRPVTNNSLMANITANT